MTKSISGMVPPHDLDAEACVISASALTRQALDSVVDRVKPEHFYSDANREIWLSILAVRADGRTVDVVTIADNLRLRNRLQAVGGPGYLVQLVDATPAVANVVTHADIVIDKAARRAAIEACHRAAAEGYAGESDTPAMLDAIEGQIHAIRTGAARETSEPALTVTRRVLDDLIDTSPRPRGIPSGLVDLDRKIGGMKPRQLIVVAALPGCGKSAMSHQCAAHVANLQAREHVLIFSLEMGKEEILERLLFGTARVDANKAIDRASLTEQDLAALTHAATVVGVPNLHIDDRRGLTIEMMRAEARRVDAAARRQGKKLAMILVDYLQLVEPSKSGKKSEGREQEVAHISRGLKGLAVELNVPVMVAAQLNADSMQRQDRRPRASDLRESKAIWADADKVILIHNPEALERAAQTDEDSESCRPERALLIIDKNRGGRVGTVNVWFWPYIVSFTSMAAGDSERYGTRSPATAEPEPPARRRRGAK